MNYDVDVRRRVDVLVVGDSVAAVAAAKEARDCGRSVTLAVAGHSAGDELTVALYGHVADPQSATLNAIADQAAAANGVHGSWIDPAVAELVIDRLLAKWGIDLMLYAIPVAIAEGDGRTAAGVVFGGKDGLFAVDAATIIDATSCGSLMRQSGENFSTPPAVSALRTIYFEMVSEDGPLLPMPSDAFELNIRRTWKSQAVVTATAAGASLAEIDSLTRVATDRISAAVIAAQPALAGATVSVTGHRVLPLSGPALVSGSPRHHLYGNVYGAGPWVTGKGWGDVDALASAGETTGRAAANAPHNSTAGLADATLENESRMVTIDETVAEYCDVLVVGGGTGGLIAALAAAKLGASVTLLEGSDNLGGIGTAGGIHVYYQGYRGGLQDEIDAVTRRIVDSLGGVDKTSGFNPEAKKIAAARMLAESSVRVVLRTTTVSAIMEGTTIRGVVAVESGKLVRYEAAAVVDATGDADIAALAGAEFAVGRTVDGVNHAYSQVAGVRLGGKCCGVNFDAGYVDATSVDDLTRARRIGLRWLWRGEAGFSDDNRWIWIAPLLGLRQSRSVIGDYVVTLDDQVQHRDFDDAIAYGSCHYDNHALDYENESDEAMLWCWGLGFWDRTMSHAVPYRSLLPRGIDGLLLACRSLSVSHDASMLFRMQRDIQRVGDAAGIAAALAAHRSITPRQLGGAPVRDVLQSRGALRKIAPIPESALTTGDLIATFDQTTGPVAVWILYKRGESVVADLIEALSSPSANTRWWSSVTLTMLGSAKGAPVLLAALRDRSAVSPMPADVPDWHIGLRERIVPRWQAAVLLLGIARCRDAAPDIAAILLEPISKIDIQLSAIRALGRIGDPASAAAISTFARRNDLPLQEAKRSVGLEGQTVMIDVAWKVALAAAETLTALGAPDLSLSARYLRDDLAYVRAYALRVHEAALEAAAHQSPPRDAVASA